MKRAGIESAIAFAELAEWGFAAEAGRAVCANAAGVCADPKQRQASATRLKIGGRKETRVVEIIVVFQYYGTVVFLL